MTTRRKRIAENLLLSQQLDRDAHDVQRDRHDRRERAARADEGEGREGARREAQLHALLREGGVRWRSRRIPIVNAQIDGDSIIYKHYVNMGIAVASEAGPRRAEHQGRRPEGDARRSSRDIGAVAKKARDGKLTMDDLTGGTFTITNGGVFGSLVSTPIINFPQVGILGLHKTQDRPIAVNGQVVIRPMMYVALSYDHRVIDGQQAVLFLVRVKELMEDPAAMLID